MEFPVSEETVEIRGHSFTIKELTMDELFPLTQDDIPAIERSKMIMSAAVTIGGRRIDPGRLPASVFNELSEVVTRVNGLADLDADEGSDLGNG